MPQPLPPHPAWQDAPTQVLGVVGRRPAVVPWQPSRAEVNRMIGIVAAVLAGVFVLVTVCTAAAAGAAAAQRDRSTSASSSTFDKYNRCVRNGYNSDGYVYVKCVDQDYVIGYEPAPARAMAPKIVGYLPQRLR